MATGRSFLSSTIETDAGCPTRHGFCKNRAFVPPGGYTLPGNRGAAWLQRSQSDHTTARFHARTLREHGAVAALARTAAHQRLGAKAAARSCYLQALAIHRKVLGAEHPETALGHFLLAFNLAIQGKDTEAEPLFRTAFLELTQFAAELAQKHGPAAGQVYELPAIQKQLPADAALVGWIDVKALPKAAALAEAKAWLRGLSSAEADDLARAEAFAAGIALAVGAGHTATWVPPFFRSLRAVSRAVAARR
jgi:hypothetical protein